MGSVSPAAPGIGVIAIPLLPTGARLLLAALEMSTKTRSGPTSPWLLLLLLLLPPGEGGGGGSS